MSPATAKPTSSGSSRNRKKAALEGASESGALSSLKHQGAALDSHHRCTAFLTLPADHATRLAADG
jgi:hypothetical protein